MLPKNTNKKLFFYPFYKKYKRILLAGVIFGLLALVAYLPGYPLDPSQLPNCGCGDVAQSAWFLSWSPFAVFHGINPYSTNWLNYPAGANLAISSSYFLYAIILSPITYLINAIATYNLLLWSSFVLSATAMFYVVSKIPHITHKFLPPFLAGLFYGFSPYMISEGTGHLNLIFIPFPPLIFYVLYKMFCTESNHKYRLAILLAILIIFQYMMSSEILATTAIIALGGCGMLFIAYPKESIRRLWNNLPNLLVTVGISVVVLGYPIYYSIYGPNHLIAMIHTWNNQFHADLLGIVVPNVGQLLYPQSWKNIGTSFLAGDWIENGSYVGAPLLLGLAIGVYRLRKNKWVQLCTVMAFFAFLLSLGPYLTIDNKNYSIPLPFDLFQHVPILDNILASRIAMYTDLFMAILVGFIIDYLINIYLSELRDKTNNFVQSIKRLSIKAYAKILAVVAVIGVIIISLIPNWPYQLSNGEMSNSYSHFFTTSDLNYIPTGAVTLAYPYPIMADNEAMVWQLLANMHFRLLGGYDLFTIPPGYPSGLPAVLMPSNVESAFSYFADYETFPLNSPPSKSAFNSIKEFVDKNHVQAILVNTEASNAKLVTKYITRDYGKPRAHAYGIDLWVIRKR
jgi:hypothetical protein